MVLRPTHTDENRGSSHPKEEFVILSKAKDLQLFFARLILHRGEIGA